MEREKQRSILGQNKSRIFMGILTLFCIVIFSVQISPYSISWTLCGYTIHQQITKNGLQNIQGLSLAEIDAIADHSKDPDSDKYNAPCPPNPCFEYARDEYHFLGIESLNAYNTTIAALDELRESAVELTSSQGNDCCEQTYLDKLGYIMHMTEDLFSHSCWIEFHPQKGLLPNLVRLETPCHVWPYLIRDYRENPAETPRTLDCATEYNLFYVALKNAELMAGFQFQFYLKSAYRRFGAGAEAVINKAFPNVKDLLPILDHNPMHEQREINQFHDINWNNFTDEPVTIQLWKNGVSLGNIDVEPSATQWITETEPDDIEALPENEWHAIWNPQKKLQNGQKILPAPEYKIRLARSDKSKESVSFDLTGIVITDPAANVALQLGDSHSMVIHSFQPEARPWKLFLQNTQGNRIGQIEEGITFPSEENILNYSWIVGRFTNGGFAGPGVYRIECYAEVGDPQLASFYSDYFSITAVLPDAVITNIALDPDAPTPGQKVTLKATIKNQGIIATPSGVDVGTAFKVDGTYLGAFFVKDANGNHKALAAGESYQGLCNVQWTATVGTHTFWAMADDVDRFSESDESNNVKESSFTIANLLPDVIVTNILLNPATPIPGQQVTVRATIKNQGVKATPAGIDVAVAFKIAGTYLGAFFVKDANGNHRSLIAGESYTGDCTTQWTAVAGTRKFWAMADDVNRFPESNEGNNVFEKNITITNPLPDVIIEDIWLEPPASGSNYKIHARIKNIGTAATPTGGLVGVGFMVDGTYLGAFFVEDTNGNKLSLAAGASFNGICTTPWVKVTGTHSFKAIADDVNRFSESNEGNNTRTESIAVQ